MIKVDLITGFLGSGKTTFLLGYAKYLLQQGLKIGIFVFDRGPVNVDFPFLRELRCDNCEIEMLAGCCDTESHQRRFKTRLIAMGMSGYDRVIIEPSGVFDMDEFFDTLQESPLDRWYELGSVITIIDAKLEKDLGDEADFLLASQAAYAGSILLSRTQQASEEQIMEAIDYLRSSLSRIHCNVPITDRIVTKEWSKFTAQDYQNLSNCGFQIADYTKITAGRALEFQSLSWLDLPLTRVQTSEAIGELYRHPELYGNIIRVKGILEEAGLWYQINATRKEVQISLAPPSGRAIIVIGNHLQENAITACLCKT